MATIKYATIRYQALDRCFGNFGKKYFIEDLIEAQNKAIYDFTKSPEGIKNRQTFDDTKFKKSDQGWFLPLARLKEGRRVYYRYSEKHFSISNKGISTNDAAEREVFNLTLQYAQFQIFTEAKMSKPSR